MGTRTIKIDAGQPIGPQVARAAKLLRAGGLVAFPTETVYGLGVVATRPKAVERLREVKGRPQSPFTVHVASADDVKRYVQHVPLRALLLIRKAWPGPLTVLLPTPSFPDPALKVRGLYERVVPAGVVGLRCPSDEVCLELLRQTDKPVIASSANRAGEAPPASGQDVLDQLDGQFDLLIDAGRTRYSESSTIVSFEGEAHTVVRAGVYDARMIQRMMGRTLLFVCSGNTCRSPIAAALARKMLAERLGVEAAELERAGFKVHSAGTFAADGVGASPGAVAAVASLGASAGRHRARKLTRELIQSSDMIFCMSRDHVAGVARLSPDAADRTWLLDAEHDIADPIGGDEQTYLGVARRIEEALRKRLEENFS